MKTLMATAAAISLLAGVSVANAQNAPASNDKGGVKIEQSAAPKVKVSSHKTDVHHAMRVSSHKIKLHHAVRVSSHKTDVHQAMRMKHRTRETTGFGGRVGPIGSGRNDASIHQSVGDRDSRDFPKQH
jgi:hypothetical protein